MNDDDCKQIEQMQAVQFRLYMDVKRLREENRHLRDQLSRINKVIEILDRSYSCLVHQRLDPKEFTKYLIRLCSVH